MSKRLILALLAVPSLASASDGDRSHYEDAKRCHIAANMIALIDTKQAGNLPASSEYGREVSERFLPVIAYEGHKLGMSQEQIIGDIRASYYARSKAMLATLNAGNKSDQMARYNELLAEVRTCAEVPSIGMASE